MFCLILSRCFRNLLILVQQRSSDGCGASADSAATKKEVYRKKECLDLYKDQERIVGAGRVSDSNSCRWDKESVKGWRCKERTIGGEGRGKEVGVSRARNDI